MTRRESPQLSTRVLLVRHAKTPSTGKVLPGRAKGLKLSDVGTDQAKRTAVRISDAFSDIAAIYASPLERTRETATPIAKQYGLSVQVAKGLIECDFGEWTGKEINKLRKTSEWEVVQNRPSLFRFPQGESFPEMQTRITQTIEELAKMHLGSTIVVVSHADPIKAAISSALGVHLDLFQRINISPCSVSIIDYGQNQTTVLSINNTEFEDLQIS